MLSGESIQDCHDEKCASFRVLLAARNSAVALTVRICLAPPSSLRLRVVPEPPRTPHELTEHNCIDLRLPVHGLYAWDLEKGKHKLNVRVDGQLTFNSTYKMLNAALAGLGLAYVPEGLARPHLARGHLKQVLKDWCPPSSGYHLDYARPRTCSAVIGRERRACWPRVSTSEHRLRQTERDGLGRRTKLWRGCTLGFAPIDVLRRVVSRPELAFSIFGPEFWQGLLHDDL